MQARRERSLARFTGIPEPGSYSAQFGPLVPSQYFKPLFQFIVQRGLITQKDADLLVCNPETLNRGRSRTFSSMRSSIESKTKKEIFQFMDSFLRLPEQYKCSWSEIFHTRLIRSPHILETVHINALKGFIFQYIERCPKEMRKHATILLSYINSHSQDIDNAIIGLTPSLMIMEEFKKFRQSHKTNPTKSEDINCYTKEQLLQKIHEWSNHEEAAIGPIVKSFVKSLQFQFLHQLALGDLVVARIPDLEKKSHAFSLLKKELEMQENPFCVKDEESNVSTLSAANIIIARFCKLDGERVLIWDTPDERETSSIKMTHVFPFTKDMLQMLHTQRGMKRLVEDEIDKMNLVLKDNIRNLVNEYLNEHKIDFDLLDRANANDVSIIDLVHLQDTLNTLRKLEDESQCLLDKVEHHIDSVINFLEPNISMTKIFHPNRSEILNTFSSWPYVSLAKNRIQRYVGVCRSSIDLINEEILNIQNGQLKYSLSRWWLEVIHDKVYKILREENYDFDAVGDSYIENPPKDMESIDRNLALIREFLKPSNEKYNLKGRLIDPLKDEIYPHLDLFEKKLITYLIMQPFSPSTSVEEFDLEEYTAALANAKDRYQLPDEVVDVISSTLMDIQYVHKMRLLEENFGNEKQKKLSDVVPVSGLALNYFHRMEMELKTVREIWDPKRIERRKKRDRRSLAASSPVNPLSRQVFQQKTSPALLASCPGQSQLRAFTGKLPRAPSLPKASPRVLVPDSSDWDDSGGETDSSEKSETEVLPILEQDKMAPVHLFVESEKCTPRWKHRSIILELANSSPSSRNFENLNLPASKQLVRCISVAVTKSEEIVDEHQDKPSLERCSSDGNIQVRDNVYRRSKKRKKKRNTQLSICINSSD